MAVNPGLRALGDSCFDLMLVDIFMPHIRGFESVRIFHERAPTVPLVAMSEYAFANLDSPAPDFLRMTLELGAVRCLRKPFTPGGAAGGRQRMSCGSPLPFQRCRPVGLATGSFPDDRSFGGSKRSYRKPCAIDRRCSVRARRDGPASVRLCLP
jgi:hypothetical protein